MSLWLKFEITNVVFACFFYTNTEPDDEFLIDLSRYHVQFARFVDQIQQLFSENIGTN